MFPRKSVVFLLVFVLLFNFSSPLFAQEPARNESSGLEVAIAGIIKLSDLIAEIESHCRTFPSWAPKSEISKGCFEMKEGIADFKKVLAIKQGSKTTPTLEASWKFLGGLFSVIKSMVEITGKIALKIFDAFRIEVPLGIKLCKRSPGVFCYKWFSSRKTYDFYAKIPFILLNFLVMDIQS